ncbi:urease accessory protein UreE [Singulisphaera acidiphila]|uniref:Urease accessory protein UreE n=1 Tax=Singulisphaera acidiphila (strain ATCC BAA-1392 / DSM 18658 / VKM B-2454 / MOB10) TaxID=886293 RepID=L0D9R5_SINAD|nr:urease accessory protein UreE [Singulisphaera acidiphila]AGA25578.1 urease accessory protein UreE [Singulisphaera acidiphila DSM 18658]
MILVEKSLGNLGDAAWAERLADATIDLLELDQWQAQKNRFRLKTQAGAEVAVALERNSHLHDGDILSWDEASRTVIATRIHLKDVLVIQLDAMLANPAETLARTCFELGHALGNQHWPAVVKGTSVYVPLTVDRQVMASVMKTHAFVGITYDFRPGSAIIPYLAPHEARRLFGGADATPHSHVPTAPKHEPHQHVDAQGQTFTHVHDTPDPGQKHDHDHVH